MYVKAIQTSIAQSNQLYFHFYNRYTYIWKENRKKKKTSITIYQPSSLSKSLSLLLRVIVNT